MMQTVLVANVLAIGKRSMEYDRLSVGRAREEGKIMGALCTKPLEVDVLNTQVEVSLPPWWACLC